MIDARADFGLAPWRRCPPEYLAVAQAVKLPTPTGLWSELYRPTIRAIRAVATLDSVRRAESGLGRQEAAAANNAIRVQSLSVEVRHAQPFLAERQSGG